MEPYFYSKPFVDLVHKIKSTKKYVRLHSITKKITDGTHYTPSYTTKGVRFISVKDVRESTVTFTNTKFISESEHLDLKRRCNPEPGDVLLTKIGTVGLAAVIGKDSPEFSLFVSVALIKPKKEVDERYLSIYLNSQLTKGQIQRAVKGIGVPDYHLEDLRKLWVILPDIEKQNIIVTRYHQALEVRQQKELQAKDLLKSIDDYLLQELGIQLPSPPPNNIQNRMFKTSWQKVAGNRFDPSFQTAVGKLISANYLNEKLTKYVLIDPTTKVNHLKDKSMVSFVPMEKLGENGEIQTDGIRLLCDNQGYTMFQEGDLLWAKITPCMENGKSAIALNLTNGVGFGSTEFFVFRQKADVNLNYLYFLLHTDFIRKDARKTFGGSAGHQRVAKEYFKKLIIPFPPLEMQARLAEEAERRRQQAFKLFSEASLYFTQTKKEIERMILE